MTLAFLDIETSWERAITIIGIYKSGEGTTQLIAPRISQAVLLQTLEGVDRLFTYNGTSFDLPVIERWLGVKVASRVPHRDLMYDCWKRKLKGGLKAVERTLGIHRDTEGVNGLQAMNLWAAHQQNCEEANAVIASEAGPSLFFIGEARTTRLRMRSTKQSVSRIEHDRSPRSLRSLAMTPCCEPMELLLRYNREDCENLKILASRLGLLQ